MKRLLWMQLFVSSMIFIGLTLVALQYQNKISTQYFDLVFERLDERLTELGYSNAKLAQILQRNLNHLDKIDISDDMLDKIVIHAYKDRYEFGFNQGIFPDTPANGTLLGYGRPSPELEKYKDIFYKLDRIWSYSDTKTSFNDKFFTNYKFKYVYSESLVSARKQGTKIQGSTLTPARFRRGIEDFYQQEILAQGFFFTYPYQNLLQSNQVISVISPVFVDGSLVGDLGVDLDIENFDEFFFLHPAFDGYVDISLQLRHSDQRLDLKQADTARQLFKVGHYQYDFDYLGTINVDYGLLFYIKQMGYFVLTLLMGLSIINYAIWQAVLRREETRLLHKQLNQDPMTKLFNRRIIDEIKLDQLPSDQDYISPHLSLPVGIILLDANKFKRINDTYGHHVGDMAILLIAQALTSSTRQGDLCIRMGGDEFLILVPNATPIIINKVQTRIHNYLNQHVLTGAPDSFRISVTSAGGLMFENESFDEAYKRMDKALYQNKKRKPIPNE